MQVNQSDNADSAESSCSQHEDTRSRFQLSAKLQDKLEKFAQWRIDPSLITFPGEAAEFRGGYATVSRALLASKLSTKSGMEKLAGPSGPNPKCTDGAQDSKADKQDEDEHRNNHSEAGKDHANDQDRNLDQDKDVEGCGDQTSQPKQPVAIKKLKIEKDADIERVLRLTLRESEILLNLSHINVVKFEGFVEEVPKHVIWLVFPWEENGNLRDFLASGEWEIPERIWLIKDVAMGVEYLHSQQPPICHGDLKSLNVLVTAEYRAAITDFGSARRLANRELDRQTKETEDKPQPKPDPGPDQESTPLQATFCASTNTITLTGSGYTTRWAAPELLNDEEPCLGSDVWALGWIAYEVMTNMIPFHDIKKDAIVINRVIQGHLPSITEDARMSLMRALCSLMVQCWSIDPTNRPTAEDFQKSIYWMPMIVPAAQGINTEVSQARRSQLLLQLGDMYKMQGDYVNASDCCRQALSLYAMTETSKGRADALMSLAEVHRYRDEDSEASKFYSEALQIFTDTNIPDGRARALWGLAEIHRNQEEFSEAIASYSEALQIHTDMGVQTSRAYALWGLATVHRFRGEYSDAIRLFSEVLQIYTDNGFKRGIPNVLVGLADVHRLRQEYSEAIKYYSEAIQMCADFGDRKGRIEALGGLAEVHERKHEYREATTLYSEVLQIYTDIGNNTWRAEALLNLARTHREQDHYNDAISFYTEASEAFGEVGDSMKAATALKDAADIRKRLEEAA